MVKIKVGDKVKVKDRKDWVAPPGYRLADSEGTVVKIAEFEEILKDFQVYLRILQLKM